MPAFRRTLSNREQRRHEDQLRWLAQGGVDADTSPMEAARPSIDVRIGYTANFFNAIFMQSIWLVIMTGVRVVARQPRIRLIDEVSVALPWGEEVEFEFLPQMEKTERYRIAHQDFDEDMIVNHQLLDGPLPVGEPREGILIAHGWGAKLPDTYKLRDRVNVTVKFVDTLGTEYPAEGDLTVNPSIDTAFKAAPRRRSSLFDQDVPAHQDPDYRNMVFSDGNSKVPLEKKFTGGKPLMR